MDDTNFTTSFTYCFVMTNFSTKQATQTLHFILQIIFLSSTIVHGILENDWMISGHKFKFEQLQVIS